MYTNSKLAKSVRLAIAFGAATATAFTSGALAQEAEDADSVEKIEVTGSRIKRSDLETPVPVAIISRDQIVQTGALNVADVLRYTPVTIAASNSSNSTFTNNSVGLNTTALRNLEQERTLVLVNGRRFVSGVAPSVGYGVDLNSIPTAMIERIEILKSASSAIYGSDAVAGVVNIITRKDFEGLEFNTQAGTSSEGDRDQYSFSITGGTNFDKGNAYFSIGYDNDDGLRSRDREFSARDQAILLDENGNEFVGDVFSSFPPQGRISTAAGSFNGDGTPFSFAQVPTTEGGTRFNRADFRQLVTPLERRYAAAGFSYELSDSVNWFGEFNWNNSATNDSTIEPVPLNVFDDIYFTDRGGEVALQLDSPLVPTLLREQLLAGGVTSFEGASFVRRLAEFGPRSTDLERDTVRIATGADWTISDNWTLGAYLSWGKTDQLQQNGGQLNVERAALALDVIEVDGQLVCRDSNARLQGCVPLNLFGAGAVTDAAVDYVRSPAKVQGQVEQLVFAVDLGGELGFELPGGAVSVALGYEFREEKGTHSPGDLAQVGASSTNRSLATNGEFLTNDYYAEALLPLLDNLELDIAVRSSNHSIVGSNTTWNVGVEYSPLETLKLRASAATAIRTPNVSDLFGGAGETFAGVSDPCNNVDANTTGVVADNCRSIPNIANRIADQGIFSLTQVEAQSTGGLIGGNPNVKEETADTFSFGFIFQPIDSLAVTVDYYDIEIDDAITTTSRTVVLNRCFDDAPGTFDPTCGGAVVRDANGALVSVNSGTSNENIIETSGIDLELDYNTEIAGGNFRAALVWTYIDEWVQTGILSGDSVDRSGRADNPEHRATLNLTYAMDDLTFGWSLRYWDSVVDSVQGNNFNFTNFAPLTTFNNIGSVTYHDASASWAVSEDITLGLVINNVFDKEPPVFNQSSNLGSTGINTFPEAYDVVGRYFSLTARFTF